MEDVLEIQNVRLRKLTTVELASIAQSPSDHWLFHGGTAGLAPPFPRHRSERSVLEIRTRCPKLTQPKASLEPQKVVVALQLLGYEIHGLGSASTWTEPRHLSWRGWQNFVLGNQGTTKECTNQQLRQAIEIARRLPDGAIRLPSNRTEVALHRFLLGCAEDNPADKLIDYVIAIEGFLLPNKEGEYRFKFSLFGSWYLAGDTTERAQLFKDLRDIYDARSKIVHGNTPEDPVMVSKKAGMARDLCARLFVKALEEGWPSHEVLKNRVFGT